MPCFGIGAWRTHRSFERVDRAAEFARKRHCQPIIGRRQRVAMFVEQRDRSLWLAKRDRDERKFERGAIMPRRQRERIGEAGLSGVETPRHQIGIAELNAIARIFIDQCNHLLGRHDRACAFMPRQPLADLAREPACLGGIARRCRTRCRFNTLARGPATGKHPSEQKARRGHLE